MVCQSRYNGGLFNLMSLQSELFGSLTITPVHPQIGAEVRGVDLSNELPEEVIGVLQALWMAHLVLVFPDQPISDEQHITFGRYFGDLEKHPSRAHRSARNEEIYRVSNVSEAGIIIPPIDTAWQYINLSWLWHTDSSFRQVPSKGSILHGIQTTAEGGNTRFANMYAAYEGLPNKTRSQIDGLWVFHHHDFIIKQSAELSTKKDKGDYETLPPARHPLVQVHPVTGRRSLFLSPHTMVGIENMPEKTGRALLDELISHSVQPEYVYTHIWSNDDILMWDNRCTMHSVEPFDNVNIPRVMHRVTLIGENHPVPV
ncbi:MAG: Alpha-ketoglutarate-dependent 2,4-dichlorophenoxyacetate dioxygenase [Alphaproteobacteria bacterium MarineAlpha4_Bin2]|nr:MAG: Alpha-ketoglutarate-dependent 2,4-dichlorophenoxyacetate dioxygenase [Alphaproteobacteria bacterium MarineAlpha4_Bin2]